MLSAPVAIDATAATSFMYSGRRFDSSSTANAPTAGTMISIDRIGKSSVFTARHPSDRSERAPASEPLPTDCVTSECASQHSPPDDEPGENQHDADADDLRVVADVAGLALAQRSGGLRDD